MAIYHFSVKVVGRSDGRSAVAAAAYRAGERLYDERHGVERDFTDKRGVAQTFILVPEGADWAKDREALWNGAEKAEVRKDATVAREYEVALPAELSAESRSQLVRAFGGELVDRYGVAVDVAIHAPSGQGDDRNWHAHVLTTTRTVEPDGLGKKTRILDAKATGPKEVEALRALWADHANRALEQENAPERVDHRSFMRRGVDVAPTTHLGPVIAGIERAALREQGLTPEKGQGIMEAISQPGFEPVTDRARGNVMAGLRNRLQEWTRAAEESLGRAFDHVAALLGPKGSRELTAALSSPDARQGMEEIARQDREARERARAEVLEREARQRERDRGWEL